LCQNKILFDIIPKLVQHSDVVPKNMLLPMMGGMGYDRGLANNGGRREYH
jgi:hypothetical protein